MRNKRVIILTFLPILAFAMVFSYYAGQKRFAYKVEEELGVPIEVVDYKDIGKDISQEEKDHSELNATAYESRNNSGHYKEALENEEQIKCNNISDDLLKSKCQKTVNDLVSYKKAIESSNINLCDEISSGSRKNACINVVNAKIQG